MYGIVHRGPAGNASLSEGQDAGNVQFCLRSLEVLGFSHRSEQWVQGSIPQNHVTSSWVT